MDPSSSLHSIQAKFYKDCKEGSADMEIEANAYTC